MSDLNQNDDLFDDFEEESGAAPTPQKSKPKGPSNRPFFAAIGFIGLLLLLAIVFAAFYTMYYLPQQNAARVQQAAEINAQNTLTAMAATDSSFAMLQTQLAPTNTAIPPTRTPIVATVVIQQMTPTSVVVFATDADAASTAKAIELQAADPAARTQTVAALLTQAAQGQPTAALTAAQAGQATALPTTGFSDSAGLPGLLGFALLLVVVAFGARRLRSAAR